jgi:hypothetical protein
VKRLTEGFPWIYIVAMGCSIAIVQSAFGIKGFAATPYARAASFIVTGAAVLSIIIQSKGKIPFSRNSTIGSIIVAFAWANMVFLIIGISNNNHRLYLATDFLYLLTLPLSYSIGSYAFKTHPVLRSTKFYKNGVLGVAVFFAALLMVQAKGVADFYIAGSAFLLMSLVTGFSKQAFFIVLLLLPHVGNASRAIVFAIALSLAIILGVSNPLKAFKASLIMSALMLVMSVIYTQTGLLRGGELERRINESTQVFTDQSIDSSVPLQQRIFELEMIEEDIKKANTLVSVLFGLGHGYTFDMSESSDNSVKDSQLMGDENTHNIHILPAAIFARMGIVGIVLYSALFVAIIRKLVFIIRTRNSKERAPELYSAIFVLLLFVFSIPASSFLLSSTLLGYFCGILDAANPTHCKATAPK